MRTDNDYRARADRGTVLIVTMWIVLVVAGLVLVMSRGVRVEAIASANRVSILQAESIARGALDYVLFLVDGTDGSLQLEDGEFEAVQVGTGYFWILKTQLSDDSTHYFGITDEASRLNLNRATPEMLFMLPEMTVDLAGAIVDWRDTDAEISPGGAESEYYLLLDEPYHCKDAPFETVEELLLVKDATPTLLYGEDMNRNGLLDPNEDDGDETEPPDDRDGALDRGFLPYLTCYSSEPNLNASDEQRVNVNSTGGQDLSDVLRTSVAEDKVFQVMELARRGRPFRNVLDFYVRTGLTPEEFGPIADDLTTSDADNITGLINVNTAPREVLLALPTLDENDVDALIEKRDDVAADLTSIAWVTEALPPEKLTEIGDHITAHSYQFSADIVSASGDGRAFKRYRAVIDARISPPRVLYWRDLTDLGWPLDPAILAELRSGEGVATTTLVIGAGR